MPEMAKIMINARDGQKILMNARNGEMMKVYQVWQYYE